MNYKIVINNPGKHIANPLLKLTDREFETREEACDTICNALYDVISGDNGCEMVERPNFDNMIESGYDPSEAHEKYISDCYAYILREGYATEDGVTATVEEA